MSGFQTGMLNWRQGSVEIFVLPASTALDKPEASLHANEALQAGDIRAETRQREFIRSRWLLHERIPGDHDFSRALSGLIQWPVDYRGSISHSQGNVAVALCPSSLHASIGLDLEAVGRVRSELSAKICRPEEWEMLQRQHQGESLNIVLAQVFAAKEALYKALYPLGLVQFWFEDAMVVESSIDRCSVELKVLRTVAPQAAAGSKFRIELKELEIDREQCVIALCAV